MKKWILLFLLLPNLAWGATTTVCASGCDYTTIQAAFNGVDLAPDDIVEVRAASPGATATFREMVTWGSNDVGSSGHPVTLQGRTGDTINIYGSTLGAGWDNSEGGSIWFMAGFTTNAVMVWRDNVAMTLAASKVAMDADGEWWMDDPNNRVYVYESDPTGHVYEIGQRTNCVYLTGGISNVTLKNLRARYSNSSGFRQEDGSNASYQNIDASYNWGIGWLVYSNDANYDTNISITDSTFSFNGDNGALTGAYLNTVTFDRCTFNNNGQNGADTFNGGLYITEDTHATSYGIIVQNCIAANNGKAADNTTVVCSAQGGQGLWFDTVGSNSGANPNIMRYNTTYNNYGTGLYLENTPDAMAYYNVSYGDGQGIQVSTSDADHPATDCLVYNNSVYNSTYCMHIQGATTDGTVVKNNIFHTASSRLMYHESGANSVINYNQYYDTSYTNKWMLTATGYSTLGAWQTGTTQDANSAAGDPLFVSAGTDFHITPSSPCKDAGTPVGLTHDITGKAVPAGAAVDIGAYEATGGIVGLETGAGSVGLGGSGTAALQ